MRMSGKDATEAFEGAGWAVREDPSGGIVGEAGRYSIRPDEKLLGSETVFELLDGELNMKVYARKVPTPERAGALLEEYGVPAEVSDITPGKVPMVPPETEGGSHA
jgi:hypothetical protein